MDFHFVARNPCIFYNYCSKLKAIGTSHSSFSASLKAMYSCKRVSIHILTVRPFITYYSTDTSGLIYHSFDVENNFAISVKYCNSGIFPLQTFLRAVTSLLWSKDIIHWHPFLFFGKGDSSNEVLLYSWASNLRKLCGNDYSRAFSDKQ